MGSVTRRMHNKSFTVDSQATILGGRNIGNEYFEADPDSRSRTSTSSASGRSPGTFRPPSTVLEQRTGLPVSVLIDKPPTPEETGRMRQQLNEFAAAQAGSVYLKALRNSDLADKLRKNEVRYSWGNAVVVYDLPEKIAPRRRRKGVPAGPAAETVRGRGSERADPLLPYFVPGGGNELPDRSRRAGRAGADPDELAGFERRQRRARRYAGYRKPLLRAVSNCTR